METRILIPDPLIWESGVEYGLQALSKLQNEIQDFVFYIGKSGKLIEAVSFGIYQLGLTEKVRYVNDSERMIKICDIILFPRVKSIGETIILSALGQGKYVVCSDQNFRSRNSNFFMFHRRNWNEMEGILKKICKIIMQY
jgi:hypothetical protein